MAICSFATWHPIQGSGAVGPYTGGPAKIVHHTTEGSTASGAFDAYQNNKSAPHFTVDATRIYQHIDTSSAARALRNAAGGVQTNKDSAIQIEVVGFAHAAKSTNTLRNVARLCRWIEANHSVPRVWPNGVPKTATPSGNDPGGHNRNATNWDTKGGYFGHCHVPENTHWDPGYTIAEVNFLMEAEFDNKGALRSYEVDDGNGSRVNIDIIGQLYPEILSRKAIDLSTFTSTMHDHHGEDAEAEYDRY